MSPDALVDYNCVKRIAVEAEKLRYGSLWANEHVTLPSGELRRDTKFFEPLITLSSLSALTSRIVLGSAIVILPFRDPFVLAKEISTLAVVAGERIVLGVGPGRFEREYASQGKSWKARTKKLEEQLRLIRQLITGEETTFHGEYYACENFSISPVPESLPIILGGAGENAVKRALRLCDGIMPGHITPEEARKMKESFSAKMQQSAPKKFRFYCEIILSIDQSLEKAKLKFENSTYVKKVPYASDLGAKALVGTRDQILPKIREYENAGVDEFILIFADETLENFLESMRLFANDVMPNF